MSRRAGRIERAQLNILNNLIEYVIQEPALGTGHAIKCVLPYISQYNNERAIILSGDVPLISIDTLRVLDGETNKLLITELENPYGDGNASKIIVDTIENVNYEDRKWYVKRKLC